MAESHHTASIRIDGDAAGAVEQTRRVTEENRKLKEQLDRTRESAQRHGDDSRRYVEALREQERQIVALTTRVRELEQANMRLPAGFRDTARASGEMAMALGVARTAIVGVVGVLTGGIVGALASAALGWVGFGSAATKAADDAEEAARRARAAAQSLPDPYAQTRENLGALIAGHGMQITSLEARRDAANSPEYRARIQARIDALREEQRLVADALRHYPPAPGEADDGGGRRDRALERELERLRQLQARSDEESLRAQHAQIEANDVLIRQAEERARRERERLEMLGEKSWEQDLLAQERAMQERDEVLRRAALRERGERERAENDLAEQRERALQRAAAEQLRMAENLERSLTDATMRGLIEGFRRGEDALENFLDRMQEAFLAAVFTPIIQPIMAPVAGVMAGVGQGIASSIWGNMAGGAPGASFGGIGGLASIGSFFGGGTSMASVNASAAAIMGGGLEAGTAAAAGLGGGMSLGAALPWVGAGLMAAYAFGAFDDDGPAQRTSGFVAPFGGGGGDPWRDNRWFSDAEMGASLRQFSTTMQVQEQNLIRNLGLDAGQISAVDAALAGTNSRRYNFGMEHTPVEQSGAFQEIASARLEAISSALGRSIEELTRVMAMSAEQWEAAIAQMERAVQSAETTLAAHVRSLPDRLGISGLQRFRTELEVAEYRTPLERIAASRGVYEDTLARAIAGDLDAVQAFPSTGRQLLSIGREVYASGPEFQALYGQVIAGLDELGIKQNDVFADIVKDVPSAVMQASIDQVSAIKQQTATLAERLDQLTREVRALQPSA